MGPRRRRARRPHASGEAARGVHVVFHRAIRAASYGFIYRDQFWSALQSHRSDALVFTYLTWCRSGASALLRHLPKPPVIDEIV